MSLDFTPPERPRRDGNLLPMINLVFLLLIFFLISAQLSPPEPVAVTPPQSAPQDEAVGEIILYLAMDGTLAFGETLSPGADLDGAILAALSAEREALCALRDCEALPPRLTLRADAGAPVARLVALLPKLGGAGFAQVDLVTTEAAPE